MDIEINIYYLQLRIQLYSWQLIELMVKLYQVLKEKDTWETIIKSVYKTWKVFIGFF